MKPGIYSRHEVADYAAINAVNYSSLKWLAKSPKHYKHHLANGAKETRPMFKGTAAHIAILEPERFALEYAIFTGKRRSGKDWREFEADARDRGKKIITSTELDEAIAMRDAVRGDSLAASYLAGGRHEVTVIWIDDETGLKCKGRLDFLRNDGVAVDIKTTRDATPFRFSQDAAKLQYHVQSAMYLDGVRSAAGHAERFVTLAVESAAPYDPVTYPLPEPVIEVGRDMYHSWLRRLVECRRDNRWPGIGNGFEQSLTLPTWSIPDSSDDVELTIGGESFAM